MSASVAPEGAAKAKSEENSWHTNHLLTTGIYYTIKKRIYCFLLCCHAGKRGYNHSGKAT